MAGASDTARFFVEQSIPELRDLERRGLFSTDEISGIAKKRSDFEHTVNGHRVTSADYARYIEFETNLEFLRRKRARRLGLKRHDHVWQRRALSLMERATRKFPGDMSLWMQYAELARKQQAFKRLSKVLTSMVRLHATQPEAWIYAANYSMGELGDMVKARSFMQRGLRFCKDSPSIWLEYAKLEMAYLAKYYARRDILGLDEAPAVPEEEMITGDYDVDEITLPTITAGEFLGMEGPELVAVPEHTKDLRQTPALSGGIPIAIFDAAMEQFQDIGIGSQFFDTVASFPKLPCSSLIIQHIMGKLVSTAPDSIAVVDISIRYPLLWVDITFPSFPRLLGEAIQTLDRTLQGTPSAELIINSLKWMLRYFSLEIDPSIQRVLSLTATRMLEKYGPKISQEKGDAAMILKSLLGKVHAVESSEAKAELWIGSAGAELSTILFRRAKQEKHQGRSSE